MIARWTPLKRSTTPIPRGKRPKARNTKRHGISWVRAFGSAERVQWVNAQGCLVRGLSMVCSGDIQNHHVKAGGGSRKADARFIVGLCFVHHAMLHSQGRQSFERVYNVALEDAAARTELRWQAFSGPVTETAP